MEGVDFPREITFQRELNVCMKLGNLPSLFRGVAPERCMNVSSQST